MTPAGLVCQVEINPPEIHLLKNPFSRKVFFKSSQEQFSRRTISLRSFRYSLSDIGFISGYV